MFADLIKPHVPSPRQLYPVAVSTIFLISCFWWQATPIASLKREVVLFGITKTTWLTNAEQWWAIPERTQFMTAVGGALALMGLAGAVGHGQRSDQPDSRTYSTTLLGILIIWQSMGVDLVHVALAGVVSILGCLLGYLLLRKIDYTLPPVGKILGFHLINVFYAFFWVWAVLAGPDPTPEEMQKPARP